MKVAILGVGTTAMIAADIIMESHNFALGGFVGTEVEKQRLARSKVYGEIPFLGDYSILGQLKKGGISRFVAAIGDNTLREERYYSAIQNGIDPVNAISRNAIIHQTAIIGQGVIISPGVVISHGVEIGDNCIFDSSVVVDVETSIGSHCYFYPNVTICGGCTIEKNVSLGAGCIIEPMTIIGKNQTIPSGTVVRENQASLYKEDR